MLERGTSVRRLLRVALAGVGWLLIGGLALAGCAAGDVVDVEEDDGGAGGMASTGGGDGGTPGTGGAGGETNPGPCEMDCSTISTQDCFQAVCNTGMYPGAVGQCVVVPRDNGTACDDGLFCTTDDSCQEGVCTGGPQNDCGMPAPECNDIACDEATKSCSSSALPDGTTCTATDLCLQGATCVAGACTGGTPKDCFFSPVPNECFVSVCNPMNGMCEPEPGNDGGGCTDQSDLCTVNKTCSAGMCQGGVPKDCSGLTAGCNIGQCDTVTGQCMAMAVPNGGMCDDLNACTTGETCSNGMCNGGTNTTACVDSDNCCPSGCQGDDPLLPAYDLDCASCDWNTSVFPFNNPSNTAVGDLTFDDQCDLYFAANNGDLYKVNRNTGAPMLLNSFSGSVRGVTYSPATNLIYVSNQDRIFSLTKGGGSLTQLPSSTTSSWINGIEVAPPGWGSFGGQIIGAKSTGEVMAFDPSTGQPTVVGNVPGSSQLSDLVFDNQTLYVVAYATQTIYTVTPTGQFTVFANAGCDADGLAIDDNQFVFYSCDDTNTINRAAIPGGQTSVVTGPNVSLNGGWAPGSIIFDGLDNIIVQSSSTFEVFTP